MKWRAVPSTGGHSRSSGYEQRLKCRLHGEPWVAAVGIDTTPPQPRMTPEDKSLAVAQAGAIPEVWSEAR